MQRKSLIKTATIFAYLKLAYVHLITCKFLVILAFKHFAFGSFLIESETWFQRWLARKTKVFVPYFEPMTLGKFRRLVIRKLKQSKEVVSLTLMIQWFYFLLQLIDWLIIFYLDHELKLSWISHHLIILKPDQYYFYITLKIL